LIIPESSVNRARPWRGRNERYQSGAEGEEWAGQAKERVGIRTARGEGEADAAGDSSLCHSQARVEGGIVDVLVAATYALSAPGAGLAGARR